MLIEDSLNPSDLAYDCIAELFQRDDKGELIRMSAYFKSINVEACTEEELILFLRRLVFSSVNQGLARIYGNFDPHLGKILRNLKLSVHTLGTFTEIDRFGELCIVPQLCDPLRHLPIVDLDELQSELSSRLRGLERIPEILAVVSRYLRDQSEHSRMVPLVRLALAIRWFYGTRQIHSNVSQGEEHLLAHEDMLTVIMDSCAEIRKWTVGGYITKGRISVELVDVYVEAIQRYLMGKVDGGSLRMSLFESLHTFIPSLTKNIYNTEHRSRLEYLTRKTEKSLLKRIQ
jgi:hypothetical protein